MQKLHDDDAKLETSSDGGCSNSDSEQQSLSYCEGCHVLRDTGKQCNIHGYGGAPLQSK
jgi:hypothetical protein